MVEVEARNKTERDLRSETVIIRITSLLGWRFLPPSLERRNEIDFMHSRQRTPSSLNWLLELAPIQWRKKKETGRLNRGAKDNDSRAQKVHRRVQTGSSAADGNQRQTHRRYFSDPSTNS